MKIIRNRCKCKACGDIIESTHRHDFKTCKCGVVSADGGLDYIKRCGDPQDILDMSEVEENQNDLETATRGGSLNDE